MTEAKKARAVGFNHVALEVGDIEEALAFYSRHFPVRDAKQERPRCVHRSRRPVHRAAEGAEAIARRRPPLRPRRRRQGSRAPRARRSRCRTYCPGRSSTSSIPGAIGSKSSATRTSSSRRRRTCCAAWALRTYRRTPMRGRSSPKRAWPRIDGYFVGIGIARSTGTAVTLFCGEPSITRSEYVR